MKRRKKPKAVEHAREPAQASPIYPYLARFLEWSRTKDLSPRTVTIRELCGCYFLRWCIDRNIERPQDITRPILERYRRHLFHYRKANGEPLSFASQQQRLVPLKVFFQWLTRENYILSNPASELEVPRTPRRLPRHILNAEEIERVLAHTMLHGELGLRDRAIIETFYSCGIRRAELANLTLYDVDLKGGTLLVREGKGRKDRFVPLGARACQWIARYLEEVRPQLVIEPDGGHVFLHEFGEPFSKNRLGDLVKKYLRAAGVTAIGSCHLFRHAMATHMLNNGADVRFLQAILGHAQLTTTEIYTHVAIGKLQEVHARTHPASMPAAPRRRGQEAGADATELLSSLAAEAELDD